MRPVTHYCRFVYLSLLFLLALPFTVQAENFTVESIHVEATGQTATEARSRAMSEAERKGFIELVTRLSDETTATRLSQERQRSISLMVQGVEVKNEKMSTSSYAADVTLSFSPEQIRALLPEATAAPAPSTTSTVPTAITVQTPVLLVLPIFTQDGQTVLLGGSSWWDTWNNAQPSGSMPFSLPIGDLEDISLVPLQAVRSGDFSQVKPLADKYHVNHIIAADATSTIDTETSTPVINVTLYDLKPDGASSQSMQFKGQPGETLPELLAKAVNGIISASGDISNQVQAATSQRLLVKAQFSSLREWQMVQQRLKSISAVQKTSVERFAGRYAVVAIYSATDADALAQALSQSGLSFTPSANMPIIRLIR